MQKPALTIDEEEFTQWKTSLVTQAVYKAMAAHAFDIKIGALEDYWDSTQWEQRDQRFVDTQCARAKIEFISDFMEMDYEQLKSYFDN